MRKPYFTILIPTRGRPSLLRDALVSALFQDFDDFEVVVSDNCNDDRTKQVLDEFRDHCRLRCIRPERLLPMPEHWEFASQHAEGTYVLFLTDRSILKRHALKSIYDAIIETEGDVPVCSWRWSLYDDTTRREFGDTPLRTGKSEMLSSQIVCEDFSRSSNHNYYTLPRGLNSCYHRELVNSLRVQYGAVFKPISPDFTSAFLLLSKINSVLYIDQALFISQGLSISNGGKAYEKTANSYLHTLGERDWFTQVPIKAPLVENVIFQDYLSIRDVVGGGVCCVNIDWAPYFERCYRELIEKSATGLLSANELEDLNAEWSRALMGQDDLVQEEVLRRLKSLNWVKLKAKLKGSAIGPFARRVKRAIDSIRHRRWKVRGGQSALEAAGFCGKRFSHENSCS